MTNSGKEWTVADCNIPGLIAGICLIILPFLGFWWSVRFGDGAFALEFVFLLSFLQFLLPMHVYKRCCLFIIGKSSFGVYNFQLIFREYSGR